VPLGAQALSFLVVGDCSAETFTEGGALKPVLCHWIAPRADMRLHPTHLDDTWHFHNHEPNSRSIKLITFNLVQGYGVRSQVFKLQATISFSNLMD